MLGSTLVKDWKKALRPTKGIHLTMSASRLPLRDAVVMATGNDKRIIFGIPRGDMVIVGTTDTDFTGDPASVHTTTADVDYLLGVVDSYFPGAHIKKSDIIASYSGVRPLVADEAGSESSTSREHRIWSVPENITFVAGGKYTTYRRMARDIVQKVLLEAFELEDRVKFARNQTRQAINPLVTPDKLQESLAQADHWAREFGLEKSTAATLTKRHGYEAVKFMQEAGRENCKSLWSIEALMAVRHTMCLHLRDFMLRRSPLFLARPDHGEAFVAEVLAVMAEELGWDATRQKEELALYREHFTQELGWQKN
jgi:glycerol-3-phosphate dehydrogenase